MKPRTLAQTLVIALIGIVMANWILAVRLGNTVPHVFQRHVASCSHVETVAIGNLVIAAGFDVSAFDQVAGGTSCNAGLGGVGFVQQYVAWRLVAENNAGIKKLVLGTFDHSLTSMKPSHWTTWHSNDALAFYVDPSWAVRYGCVNKADEMAFRVMRHIPMFTERGGLWGKVEHLRRLLGSTGMPATDSNRFGRVADSALLLKDNMELFEWTSLQAIQNHAALTAPVADLLSEARQKGILTFIVLMPLPKERHKFYATPAWKAYVGYLRGLIAESGSQLIEATDWSESPKDFDDSVHLSKTGAALFSKRLAETISHLP
jgi:hypothetical protein